MFFSVQELELRKIAFHAAFAPGALDFGDSRLKQESPIEAKGWAELVGPVEEIRVHGHLGGRFSAACDRCLEPMPIPIGGDFDLIYMPTGMEGERTEEHAIREEDTDVGYYTGAGVELSDVVLEQVLLWMPMHRVCRDDCKGICPVCGQDRNLLDCGCRERPGDERWAALKNISGV